MSSHAILQTRLAQPPCFAFIVCLAFYLTTSSCAAQEKFDGWDLEPSIRQAHLVIVARVASISSLTVVEGAKTDVALREYRFQPVRRLKGIFQRDQLSMSGTDLGCPAEDPAVGCPLKEGEFRLLILVQQQGLPSMGCVAASPGVTTFAERVPLLTGVDDPLVATVETLIQVTNSNSRRERAKLIVDRLQTATGLAAEPLLASLKVRADWSATDPRTLPALAQLTRNQPAPVREAALETMRDLLENRLSPEGGLPIEGVADALRDVLIPNLFVCCDANHPTRTSARLAAIDDVGHLLSRKVDIPWATNWLNTQLTSAATHAERAAAATALARSGTQEAATAVCDALARLPLDEPAARESIYAQAAISIAPQEAERILAERLNNSIIAHQSLEAEVQPLGRMGSKSSLQFMLYAAERQQTSEVDRARIAEALGRLRDDAAVPLLTGWLRGNDHRLKETSLAALETIDSPLAAREVRPLLKTEPFLPRKLRIARLLARHGVADGYALATEHLADSAHTAQAILVLTALDDPRTSKELSKIVAEQPDRRWHAVAVGALAAIGNAEARGQLLTILNSDRHPLAADAAQAAGLSDDDRFLIPLAKLTQSRNKQLAMTALVATQRYLRNVRSSSRGLAMANDESIDFVADDLLEGPMNGARLIPPVLEMPTIYDAVAALAVDAYAEMDVRSEALAIARLLHTNRYAELLDRLADQAELEGTPLLKVIQAERRRLHKVQDGC